MFVCVTVCVCVGVYLISVEGGVWVLKRDRVQGFRVVRGRPATWRIMRVGVYAGGTWKVTLSDTNTNPTHLRGFERVLLGGTHTSSPHG